MLVNIQIQFWDIACDVALYFSSFFTLFLERKKHILLRDREREVRNLRWDPIVLPVPVTGIINSGKKELLERSKRGEGYSVLGFEFKNRLLIGAPGWRSS